jgi:hypothetical protein
MAMDFPNSPSVDDEFSAGGRTWVWTGSVWNLVAGDGVVISDLNDLTDVVITSATSGDFLKYNGSDWVNDPINLSTDTVGDYVASLTAGTNVSLTNNSGEAASPTVTVSGNLTSIDSVSSPDYIQFDTTYSAASTAAGKLQWDLDYGTLQFALAGGNVDLRLGQEQFVKCYNAESTTLTKGTVVYIYGAQGDQVAIKRANNSSDTTSSKTLGIVAESISASSSGYVITQGLIVGINTSAYSSGDILWLSSTDGQFTKTKPVAPEHLVFIGVVVKVNSSAGQVFVKPQNGYELDEIHNVSLTTPASGDFLKYNGTLWVNDPINLSTDTTGDYVASLVAGTGITLSNNSGEGATPTIAVDLNNTNTSSSTTQAATANALRELQIKFLMEVI